MGKSLVIMLLISTICISVEAQKFNILGCLIDDSGNPIEMANVLIFNYADSAYVDGMITDTVGCFKFSEPQGDYELKISMLGFRTASQRVKLNSHVDLGNIVVESSTVAMKDVTVAAARSMIRREIDRVVFDAQNTIAVVGGSALDLLSNVPGLRVTQTSISIIGKGGVKVFVNDREIQLTDEELIGFLRSYSAAQIDKVEVITIPPAKYGAEGNAGILNIRLKPTMHDHIGGDIYSSYFISDLDSYGYSGADARFNKGRVTATIDGTLLYGSYGYIERNVRYYSDQTWRSRNRGTHDVDALSLDGGVDVELNNKWLVGSQLRYNHQMPDASLKSLVFVGDKNEVDVDSFMVSNENRNITSDRFAADFHVDKEWGNSGKKMVFDAGYIKDKTQNTNTLESNVYLNDSSLVAGSDLNYDKHQNRHIDVYSTSFDFDLPFENFVMTAGARASYSNSTNRLVYDNSSVSYTQNDLFRYKEQVFALYADYSKNIGEAFSFKGGLRLEHTRTQGVSQSENTENDHSYTRLFPTLYLLYKLNADNVFNISMSNRIQRPAQNMVNPFVSYSNKYDQYRGKEDLKPSYSYNAEVSYVFKNNLNFSVFYSYSDDLFSQRAIINEEEHTLFMQWDNFFENHSFGLNNSYTYSKNWLRTYLQHGVSYTKTTSSAPESMPKNSGFSYNVSISNTFYFNAAKTILAQLSGNFASPSYNSVSKAKCTYDVNAGLRCSLLDSKLNLSVNADNIITTNYRGTVYSYNARMKYNNTFSSATLRLGVTYNFGADIHTKDRNTSSNDVERRL